LQQYTILVQQTLGMLKHREDTEQQVLWDMLEHATQENGISNLLDMDTAGPADVEWVGQTTEMTLLITDKMGVSPSV
jgi:hypothetical protein